MTAARTYTAKQFLLGEAPDGVYTKNGMTVMPTAWAGSNPVVLVKSGAPKVGFAWNYDNVIERFLSFSVSCISDHLFSPFTQRTRQDGDKLYLGATCVRSPYQYQDFIDRLVPDGLYQAGNDPDFMVMVRSGEARWSYVYGKPRRRYIGGMLKDKFSHKTDFTRYTKSTYPWNDIPWGAYLDPEPKQPPYSGTDFHDGVAPDGVYRSPMNLYIRKVGKTLYRGSGCNGKVVFQRCDWPSFSDLYYPDTGYAEWDGDALYTAPRTKSPPYTGDDFSKFKTPDGLYKASSGEYYVRVKDGKAVYTGDVRNVCGRRFVNFGTFGTTVHFLSESYYPYTGYVDTTPLDHSIYLDPKRPEPPYDRAAFATGLVPDGWYLSTTSDRNIIQVRGGKAFHSCYDPETDTTSYESGATGILYRYAPFIRTGPKKPKAKTYRDVLRELSHSTITNLDDAVKA